MPGFVAASTSVSPLGERSVGATAGRSERVLDEDGQRATARALEDEVEVATRLVDAAWRLAEREGQLAQRAVAGVAGGEPVRALEEDLARERPEAPRVGIAGDEATARGERVAHPKRKLRVRAPGETLGRPRRERLSRVRLEPSRLPPRRPSAWTPKQPLPARARGVPGT